MPPGYRDERLYVLRLTRTRPADWGVAIRGALLLIGGLAGLAAIITSLVSAVTPIDAFDLVLVIGGLALTTFFGLWRVAYQFGTERLHLVAGAVGLTKVTPTGRETIDWEDARWLRFANDRRRGRGYSLARYLTERIDWPGAGSVWREAPMTHDDGLDVTRVDGDMLAAIVATRVGWKQM